MNSFTEMYYLPSISSILRDGLEADARRGRDVDVGSVLSQWLELPHAVRFDGHLLVASGVATSFFALAEQEPGYQVGTAFDAHQGLSDAVAAAGDAGIPAVMSESEQYMSPHVVVELFRALVADGVVTPLADEGAWAAALSFDLRVLENAIDGPETAQ